MKKNIYVAVILFALLILTSCGQKGDEEQFIASEKPTVIVEREPEWLLIEQYHNYREGCDNWFSYQYNENGDLLVVEARFGGNAYSIFDGVQMVSTTEYVYNESGVCTEVIAYNDRDEVELFSVECDEYGNIIREDGEYSELIYKYDEKGNCLEEKWNIKSAENDSGYHRIWTYNENGDILTETTIQNDGDREVRLNSYDIDGRLIRTDRKGYWDGELSYWDWTDIFYDGSMEYWYYSDDDGFVCSIEKTKDESGNVLEDRSYSAEGECGAYTTYEYDEFGNLIREMHYTVVNGEERLTEMIVNIYKLI